LHNTIIWVFLNCLEWYLCITHALNKLVSIEISSARLICSTLFKMFEMSDALSAFILLIICLTSSSEMRESDDTVKNINELAMSLTFVWEDERKNFSCNISIFLSNIIIICSMSLHFNDENWESFLNSWLLILTHFVKRYINSSALLSSCICDLKCARFACWMILFLWSLCFRYLFHASNMFYVFHTICSRLDFITISKQFKFQKFFAWLDDFVKKIDFSMIFCNILITLHILSFIIILLFKEWFDERCICKYALNASIFILFHSHWVEDCTEVVYRQSSVTIERWFNSWCRLMHILHLHVMNCIFSLLKTRLIVVNWLWVLQVIMSDFSNSFSLMLIMMSSKLLIAAYWVKHLHFFQWEWCKLKSFMISCLQSSLNNSLKREMIEDFFVNVKNSEHEL